MSEVYGGSLLGFFKRKKDFGYHPLHRAVIDGDIDKARHYLHLKNVPTPLGLTPLMLARFLARKEHILLLGASELPLFFPDQKEELENRFNFTYLPHLEFDSIHTLETICDRTEKVLKDKTTRAMNHWTKSLHERTYRNSPLDFVTLKYVNPLVGYGIFAKKPLAKLTLVGEYTGEVRKRSKKGDRFNDYIFSFSSGPKTSPYIIDARHKGNLTRFINHSEEPNCISRWMVIDGITRIIFYTKEALNQGEQLTYDYGKFYWRSRIFPQVL